MPLPVTKKQLKKLNQKTEKTYHVNSTEILPDVPVQCNLQGNVTSEQGQKA